MPISFLYRAVAAFLTALLMSNSAFPSNSRCATEQIQHLFNTPMTPQALALRQAFAGRHLISSDDLTKTSPIFKQAYRAWPRLAGGAPDAREASARNEIQTILSMEIKEPQRLSDVINRVMSAPIRAGGFLQEDHVSFVAVHAVLQTLLDHQLLPARLGEFLRLWPKSMSGVEASKRIGASSNQLSKVQTDRALLTRNQMALLAMLLGIDFYTLYQYRWDLDQRASESQRYLSDFGQRFKALRHARDSSTEKFKSVAGHIEVDLYVRSLESGWYDPSLAECMTLASIFNMSVADLLDFDQPPTYATSLKNIPEFWTKTAHRIKYDVFKKFGSIEPLGSALGARQNPREAAYKDLSRIERAKLSLSEFHVIAIVLESDEKSLLAGNASPGQLIRGPRRTETEDAGIIRNAILAHLGRIPMDPLSAFIHMGIQRLMNTSMIQWIVLYQSILHPLHSIQSLAATAKMNPANFIAAKRKGIAFLGFYIQWWESQVDLSQRYAAEIPGLPTAVRTRAAATNQTVGELWALVMRHQTLSPSRKTNVQRETLRSFIDIGFDPARPHNIPHPLLAAA